MGDGQQQHQHDAHSGDAEGVPPSRERDKAPHATPVTTWSIAARNFAIALVQRLEASLERLQQIFKTDMSPYGFVLLLADFIDRTPPVLQGHGSGRPDVSKVARDQIGALSRQKCEHSVLCSTKGMTVPQKLSLCRAASSASHILSYQSAPLRDSIKRWEATMLSSWERVASGDEQPASNPFARVEQLEFSLWHLFKAIDYNQTDRLACGTFLAYLFDSILKGKAGTSSQEDIRQYAVVHRDASPNLLKVRRLTGEPETSTIFAHCIGKGGHVLRTVDSRTLSLKEKDYRIPMEHGNLISYDVIPSVDWLVVSTADAIVRVLDMKTHQLKFRKKNVASVTVVRWSDKHNRIYCGLRTGEVQIWSLNVPKSFDFDSRKLVPEPVVDVTAEVHTDAVTNMVFLPFDGHLITSSADSKLKCLNVKTLKVVRTLQGHTKGITHLVYSHPHNLLISAGYEYNPLCWVTNVSTSKHFQLRDGYKPHTSSIAAIALVAGSPQCISLDKRGTVKIWDLRTIQCVQTVSCEPNCSKEEAKVLNFHDLLYHGEQRRLLVAGSRKTYVIQYNVQGRTTNPLSAMEYGISAMYFSQALGLIYTCSRRDVKGWDIRTGTVVFSSDRLTTDDIATITVDADGTVAYIGCADGSVLAFSTTTGAVTARVVVPSRCEVLEILLLPDSHPHMLLCVSQGGGLHVVTNEGHDKLHCDNFIPAPQGGQQQQAHQSQQKEHHTAAARHGGGTALSQQAAHGGQRASNISHYPGGTSALALQGRGGAGRGSPGPAHPSVDARVLCLHAQFGALLVGQGHNSVLVFKRKPTRSTGQLMWIIDAECTSSPYGSEITAVASLEGIPFFACSDNSGGVNLFSLSGASLRSLYTCATRWVNNLPDGVTYTPSVTCFAFLHQYSLVYTADDAGFVNVYKISDGIQGMTLQDTPQPSQAIPKAAGGGGVWRKLTVRPGNCNTAPTLGGGGAESPRKGGGGGGAGGGGPVPMAGMIQSWRAHSEAVSTLLILQHPFCIATAGGDGTVVFWTLWGARIAQLSKQAAPGSFTLSSETSAEAEGGTSPYDDIPWPHNPSARKGLSLGKLLDVANAFRRAAGPTDRTTTVRHILDLAVSGGGDGVEVATGGVALLPSIAIPPGGAPGGPTPGTASDAMAAAQDPTSYAGAHGSAPPPPDAAGMDSLSSLGLVLPPCANPSSLQVSEKELGVVKSEPQGMDLVPMLRQFTVFYKSRKEILKWLKDPTCPDGDIETPEVTGPVLEGRKHFVSHLITQSPPTPAQLAAGMTYSPDKCVPDEGEAVCVAPVVKCVVPSPIDSLPDVVLSSPLKYRADVSARDVLTASPEAWSEFVEGSQRKAVVKQKTAHRANIRAVPASVTRAFPMSGHDVGSRMQPHCKYARRPFVRKGPPQEPVVVPRSQAGSRVVLHPLKQQRAPKLRYRPEAAHFSPTSSMEWSTSGDCIAVRKLQSHQQPYCKSWLVS